MTNKIEVGDWVKLYNDKTLIGVVAQVDEGSQYRQPTLYVIFPGKPNGEFFPSTAELVCKGNGTFGTLVEHPYPKGFTYNGVYYKPFK